MRFLRRLFAAFEGGRPAGLSPRCAVCRRTAATIGLSEDPGGWLLRYSGPGGSNGSGDRIPAERAAAIRKAFTPPYAVAAIKAAGFYDDAGFCAGCAKFYCPQHWNTSPTGGGRCPQGHFKSLDPHWSPDE